MSSPVSYDLQGQGGGIVIAGGDAIPSGNFRWIQVVNDAVFASLGGINITNSAGLAGITLPAGLGIGGLFEQPELTSGVVIAYYA